MISRGKHGSNTQDVVDRRVIMRDCVTVFKKHINKSRECPVSFVSSNLLLSDTFISHFALFFIIVLIHL